MFVHRSRWVEELAAGLAELLATPCSGADALEPDIVAIQGRGTERWLSLRLADELGVWANAEFPFPRQCISSMLDAVLGDTPAGATLFDVEQSAFVIARLLAELPAPELAEPRRYLERVGDHARLSLARRVARVFDQYAVYRPELLLRWDEAPEADWQSLLWHELSRAAGHAHLPGRARRFFEQLRIGLTSEMRARLPRRVSFFGVTSLPPLYVQLLSALGQELEVHLFLLSPSDEYWADVRDQREQLRLQLTGGGDFEHHGGHPLLAELGHRSRDMQAVLETNDDYQELPTPRLPQAPPDTLLRLLQDDMAALKDRSAPDAERVRIAEDDDSISLHSCHMPARELEVLRDRLLDAFERDPTLRPHEVVVMAPSIESYAPLVEAIFGASDERGRVAIPFRVADRVGRDVLPRVDAFFALVTFLSSRMRAPELLDLLRRDAIARPWGIREEDLPLVTGWLASCGIRFGADAAHRRAEGLPESDMNTIRFGLDRLLLGVAIDGRDSPAPFAGHLPEPVDSSEFELLGHFVSCLEALSDARSALAGELSCALWAERLRRLVDDFLVSEASSTSSEEDAELDLLRSQLASVAESARAAGFESELPLSVFLSELQARIGKRHPSVGLFGGGVTFCQLVPMRALPFRVVALLGMGDGFPRLERRADFDRMGKQPRLGDPCARDDDRQLFLEAILSARERLLITYVGQSAQDNSTQPPSVVVSALLDHLAQAYEFDGVDAEAGDRSEQLRRRLVIQHPLSRMSPRYFDGSDPRLFSYSESDRDAALALLAEARPRPSFLEGVSDAPVEPSPQLTLHELEAALTRPVRRHLELRFGLFTSWEDAAPQGDDPLALSGFERSSLGRELLAQMGRGVDDDALLQRVWAGGLLPHGNPGRTLLRELVARARAVHRLAHGSHMAPPTRARRAELDLGATRLYGILLQPESGDRVETRFSTLGATHELGAWLRHLVSCAAFGPSRTLLVGGDGSGARAVAYRPVDQARPMLTQLCQLAQSLPARALPLIPDISLRYARRRRDPKKRSGALAKARAELRSSFVETKYQRAFEDRRMLFADRLDSLLGSEDGPFAQLAETVFGPLLDHVEGT
ncbi:MAG: exodeoxyribonuclease V subunit gamma [Deltaproteobacteria bacterium]|nr:exodeoxyribonuclease V subunit gamma [Deltaproteobacteria bacterium]